MMAGLDLDLDGLDTSLPAAPLDPMDDGGFPLSSAAGVPNDYTLVPGPNDTPMEPTIRTNMHLLPLPPPATDMGGGSHQSIADIMVDQTPSMWLPNVSPPPVPDTKQRSQRPVPPPSSDASSASAGTHINNDVRARRAPKRRAPKSSTPKARASKRKSKASDLTVHVSLRECGGYLRVVDQALALCDSSGNKLTMTPLNHAGIVFVDVLNIDTAKDIESMCTTSDDVDFQTSGGGMKKKSVCVTLGKHRKHTFHLLVTFVANEKEHTKIVSIQPTNARKVHLKVIDGKLTVHERRNQSKAAKNHKLLVPVGEWTVLGFQGNRCRHALDYQPLYSTREFVHMVVVKVLCSLSGCDHHARCPALQLHNNNWNVEDSSLPSVFQSAAASWASGVLNATVASTTASEDSATDLFRPLFERFNRSPCRCRRGLYRTCCFRLFNVNTAEFTKQTYVTLRAPEDGQFASALELTTRAEELVIEPSVLAYFSCNLDTNAVHRISRFPLFVNLWGEQHHVTVSPECNLQYRLCAVVRRIPLSSSSSSSSSSPPPSSSSSSSSSSYSSSSDQRKYEVYRLPTDGPIAFMQEFQDVVGVLYVLPYNLRQQRLGHLVPSYDVLIPPRSGVPSLIDYEKQSPEDTQSYLASMCAIMVGPTKVVFHLSHSPKGPKCEAAFRCDIGQVLQHPYALPVALADRDVVLCTDIVSSGGSGTRLHYGYQQKRKGAPRASAIPKQCVCGRLFTRDDYGYKTDKDGVLCGGCIYRLTSEHKSNESKNNNNDQGGGGGGGGSGGPSDPSNNFFDMDDYGGFGGGGAQPPSSSSGGAGGALGGGNGQGFGFGAFNFNYRQSPTDANANVDTDALPPAQDSDTDMSHDGDDGNDTDEDSDSDSDDDNLCAQDYEALSLRFAPLTGPYAQLWSEVDSDSEAGLRVMQAHLSQLIRLSDASSRSATSDYFDHSSDEHDAKDEVVRTNTPSPRPGVALVTGFPRDFNVRRDVPAMRWLLQQVDEQLEELQRTRWHRQLQGSGVLVALLVMCMLAAYNQGPLARRLLAVRQAVSPFMNYQWLLSIWWFAVNRWLHNPYKSKGQGSDMAPTGWGNLFRTGFEVVLRYRYFVCFALVGIMATLMSKIVTLLYASSLALDPREVWTDSGHVYKCCLALNAGLAVVMTAHFCWYDLQQAGTLKKISSLPVRVWRVTATLAVFAIVRAYHTSQSPWHALHTFLDIGGYTYCTIYFSIMWDVDKEKAKERDSKKSLVVQCYLFVGMTFLTLIHNVLRYKVASSTGRVDFSDLALLLAEEAMSTELLVVVFSHLVKADAQHQPYLTTIRRYRPVWSSIRAKTWFTYGWFLFNIGVMIHREVVGDELSFSGSIHFNVFRLIVAVSVFCAHIRGEHIFVQFPPVAWHLVVFGLSSVIKWDPVVCTDVVVGALCWGTVMLRVYATSEHKGFDQLFAFINVAMQRRDHNAPARSSERSQRVGDFLHSTILRWMMVPLLAIQAWVVVRYCCAVTQGTSPTNLAPQLMLCPLLSWRILRIATGVNEQLDDTISHAAEDDDAPRALSKTESRAQRSSSSLRRRGLTESFQRQATAHSPSNKLKTHFGFGGRPKVKELAAHCTLDDQVSGTARLCWALVLLLLVAVYGRGLSQLFLCRQMVGPTVWAGMSPRPSLPTMLTWSMAPCAWEDVTQVNLDGAGLTELPSSLTLLSNLTVLSASHNELVEVPRAIGKLSQLATLALDHNYLTSLPAELVSSPTLQYIDVSNNFIRFLPPELFDNAKTHKSDSKKKKQKSQESTSDNNHPILQAGVVYHEDDYNEDDDDDVIQKTVVVDDNPFAFSVDWCHCNLTYIPSSFLSAVEYSLVDLRLCHNQFEAFPWVSVLSRLGRLRTLDLSYNKIRQWPPMSLLPRQPAICRVNVSNNALSAPPEDWLTSRPNLILDWSNNSALAGL